MDIVRNDILPQQTAIVGTADGDPGASLTELLPAIRHFRREVSLMNLYERDEPAARHIEERVGALRSGAGIEAIVPQVLEGALELTEADLGNVQLLNPATGALEIAAHAGFSAEFLEYFAIVDDDSSACGRAAQQGIQTIIDDVTIDPGFTPHREMAAASRFRAVQSTPLKDRTGAVIGMLSTHFPSPGAPSRHAMRTLELYAQLAGESIAQALPFGDADGAPHAPDDALSAWLELLWRHENSQRALRELAENTVQRIFSASLSLAAVQSAAVSRLQRERIANAIAELDMAIREIQGTAVDRLLD